MKPTRALIAASLLGLLLSITSVAYSAPAVSAALPTMPTAAAEAEPDESAPATPEAQEPTVEAQDEAISAEPTEVTAEPAENLAEKDPAGTATEVYSSLKAGKWLIAFGGILMFLVWGVRLLLGALDITWFKGELGGNILAFGTAFSLAIGTALLAGEPISVGLMMAAAGAAWAAKGNWSHVQAAKAK